MNALLEASAHQDGGEQRLKSMDTSPPSAARWRPYTYTAPPRSSRAEGAQATIWYTRSDSLMSPTSALAMSRCGT